MSPASSDAGGRCGLPFMKVRLVSSEYGGPSNGHRESGFCFRKAGALPRSDAQHVPSVFLGASWMQADGLFLS